MCRKTSKKNMGTAGWLIVLAWLVYTVSYFGKVNYSANITQMIAYYGITKAQAGMAPTMFFFAYGVGQILNGFLCKKYSIKWMVFCSLVISAVINLLVGITPHFSVIRWLWMINGLVLSTLWPTLVRLLSETLPQKALGTSSVIMGTTVAFGTLIIYGISAVYAALDCFKLSFYTAAFTGATVAIIWLFLYQKAVTLAGKEKTKELADDAVELKRPTERRNQNGGSILFGASVCVLCFYAVGVNLIKDGLITWVPSVLKEEFMFSDSLSIFLTLFLAVLAVFGNVFALKAHTMLPDYVTLCALTFGVIALLIAVIIGSLILQIAVFVLIGLIIVAFLASGLNSLLTSVFPLFMRDQMNSGFAAGIINGFCYVGSTISAYGLGAIADRFGWHCVFAILIGFCVVAIAIWGGYFVCKMKITHTK